MLFAFNLSNNDSILSTAKMSDMANAFCFMQSRGLFSQISCLLPTKLCPHKPKSSNLEFRFIYYHTDFTKQCEHFSFFQSLQVKPECIPKTLMVIKVHVCVKVIRYDADRTTERGLLSNASKCYNFVNGYTFSIKISLYVPVQGMIKWQ